ncbi:synaptotagmin-3-like isoform X2 [Pyrus x bretschneideri]|uniref:synaptotagmin-3-like isoform X2 n=1 Tax=Pyrus x bretschneideri TaxID=225117 RepID=UPI00202E229D|nr:synaptotagmin-3-like isoform X2 [Pyrus x bretschneideri]
MGWQSQHSCGVKVIVSKNYGSVSGFASICSTTGYSETSCANVSMFCKHYRVFIGEATCRFWNQNIGRGRHGHTRPLSVCSGASPVILFWETIKKQVASLYLWPQTLEIPVLDASMVAKKPVGILHVKVVRALKLLKMDILGSSDPYVKLNLTEDKLPAKQTTVKMNKLNPEWNEKFRLIVKDPQTQALELQLYDWDKVGRHDKLGMQLVPLKVLTPGATKEFVLDLVKNTNINDPQNKKRRGQVIVEVAFVPFKSESSKHNGTSNGYGKSESGKSLESDESLSGAGVLSILIQGAEDVEGEHHSNPYALVCFRGEVKKTKMIRKSRNPLWNEDFQFMLDEPPLHDKIRIELKSKSRALIRAKESLGYVEINLADVVHNGRINEKFHLIDSHNGRIHAELSWTKA